MNISDELFKFLETIHYILGKMSNWYIVWIKDKSTISEFFTNHIIHVLYKLFFRWCNKIVFFHVGFMLSNSFKNNTYIKRLLVKCYCQWRIVCLYVSEVSKFFFVNPFTLKFFYFGN